MSVSVRDFGVAWAQILHLAICTFDSPTCRPFQSVPSVLSDRL